MVSAAACCASRVLNRPLSVTTQFPAGFFFQITFNNFPGAAGNERQVPLHPGRATELDLLRRQKAVPSLLRGRTSEATSFAG